MPREVNGHQFDFDRDVCLICGMSRPKFDDSDSPRCSGVSTQSSMIAEGRPTGKPRK